MYLFKHLGTGRNGDCCLATTENKKLFCAVTFFAEKSSALDCATNECNLWNDIYGEQLPKALVVGLPPTTVDSKDDEDACLCMPYLIPIDTKTDRLEALKNDSIRNALKEFASKNYHHNEVFWRHVIPLKARKWVMVEIRTV
mmetsp:Transcript_22022/g.37438  ORF Transcript_22022/g.37438 Transcript_22022/m.37438 type:complete len:142 (-) Transcript_22022:319-744(-)